MYQLPPECYLAPTITGSQFQWPISYSTTTGTITTTTDNTVLTYNGKPVTPDSEAYKATLLSYFTLNTPIDNRSKPK